MNTYGMNSHAFRELAYIYWQKDAVKKVVKMEDFKKIHDEIASKREKVKYTTKRDAYNDKTYSISSSGNYFRLYY